METRDGINISQKDIDEFFADIKHGNRRNEIELTDFQKAIIIKAYEDQWNKEQTSKKLNVSEKRMRAYYEDYKSSKK